MSIKRFFSCPHCGETHETRSAAYWCCGWELYLTDADINRISTKSFWACTECNTWWDSKSEAFECCTGKPAMPLHVKQLWYERAGQQRLQLGFSLLEMAFVLAIIGALASFILPMIKGAVEFKQQTTTQANAKAAEQALIGYSLIHKSLPCPDSNGDGKADACGNSAVLSGLCPYDDLGTECKNATGKTFEYAVQKEFTSGDISEELLKPGNVEIAEIWGSGVQQSEVSALLTQTELAAIFANAGLLDAKKETKP